MIIYTIIAAIRELGARALTKFNIIEIQFAKLKVN